MPASTLLTIDDFERLPAEAAENHELVEGELVDVSGNTPRHNKLRDRLLALMLSWMTEHGLGTAIAEQEFDFLGNAHGPDVRSCDQPKQRCSISTGACSASSRISPSRSHPRRTHTMDFWRRRNGI